MPQLASTSASPIGFAANAAASRTGAPDNPNPAKPTQPRSPSTPTETTLLLIDWTKLSDTGVVILQKIALPISQGFSTGEISAYYGQPASWASALLDDLRDELSSLANR
jgi:hypothetical protein